MELKGEIETALESQPLPPLLPPKPGEGGQPASARTREKASRLTLPSYASRLTLVAPSFMGSGSLDPWTCSMKPWARRSGSLALRSSVRTCAASRVPVRSRSA